MKHILLAAKNLAIKMGFGNSKKAYKIYLAICKLLIPKGLGIVQVGNMKFYVDRHDKTFGLRVFVDKTYEYKEDALLRREIAEGSTALDIGANIGYYSVLLSKIVGEKGKVYAFEPVTATYKILENNIRINLCSNVIPLQLALSNRNGKRNVFTNSKNLGIASFSDCNPKTIDGHTKAETTTIDKFARENSLEIDFIKIDAEGAEGLILEGATETLKRKNLKLLIEIVPSLLKSLGTEPLELLELLEHNGFSIKAMNYKGAEKEMSNNEIVAYAEKYGSIDIYVWKAV